MRYKCTMTLTPLQHRILQAALPHVVFDGWTMQTLRAGATDEGLPELEADRAFAGGVIEALNLWMRQSNADLAEQLANQAHLPSMKIRDRIAFAVMLKLRAQQANRDAVRRALAIYALPWHAADGLASLYDTVDTIWRAAGDTATDWNFYSKRLLLGKVYMSTLNVWLADDSPDQAESEAFLRRRIEDVMQIQKTKFKVKEWAEGLMPKAKAHP